MSPVPGDVVAEGTYSFLPSNAAELKSVFENIASASGSGSSQITDKAVTVVDIVSKSFMLPDGADTDISVFTAPCTGGSYVGEGDDAVFMPTFGPRVEDTDLEDSAVIKKSQGSDKMDEIDVSGFDYSENFVGPYVDEQGKIIQGRFTGKKLIIEIPIKMDPNALGGPLTPTNAPGSGIIVEGATEPIVKFTSPVVSLPYNLHITKTQLRKGESAKFKIEKGIGTYNADKKAVAPDPDGDDWTYMTTVMITGSDADTTTPDDIWVRGLPATEVVSGEQQPVFYRVSEDNWSWSYNAKTGAKITDNNVIDNPMTFENELKDDIDQKVRHAESKATNTFKSGTTTVKYDDSKTNSGTGRD